MESISSVEASADSAASVLTTSMVSQVTQVSIPHTLATALMVSVDTVLVMDMLVAQATADMELVMALMEVTADPTVPRSLTAVTSLTVLRSPMAATNLTDMAPSAEDMVTLKAMDADPTVDTLMEVMAAGEHIRKVSEHRNSVQSTYLCM